MMDTENLVINQPFNQVEQPNKALKMLGFVPQSNLPLKNS